MTESEHNREPFAEPLVHAGFPDDVNRAIRTVPGRPELVVRQQTLELAKDPAKGVGLLRELDSEYGIALPTVRPFIAEDRAPQSKLEDRRHIYLVCDRIEGVNLYNAISEGQVSAQEVRELFGSLLRYFGDKYQKGEPFITDLTSKFSQYKYGHNLKAPNESPKIYLVDTDPVYEVRSNDYVDDPKYPPALNDRLRARADVLYMRALSQGLADLDRLMDSAEEAGGFNLEQERATALELRSAIEFDGSDTQVKVSIGKVAVGKPVHDRD